MKNIVKIFSIIIITLFILCAVTNSLVYAQDLVPNPGDFEPPSDTVPTNITSKMSVIANIIQVAGIVISVIVVILLGIKYLLGSVEERADYKKAIIPFLIGAFFLTGTGTILKIINNITSQSI